MQEGILYESVLPRILSQSRELARFVGAHSVRPRADNVRPYIKSANRTHPSLFRKRTDHSAGVRSSMETSSFPSLSSGTDQPGALASPLPSLRLVMVYRYFLSPSSPITTLADHSPAVLVRAQARRAVRVGEQPCRHAPDDGGG